VAPGGVAGSGRRAGADAGQEGAPSRRLDSSGRQQHAIRALPGRQRLSLIRCGRPPSGPAPTRPSRRPSSGPNSATAPSGRPVRCTTRRRRSESRR
jgi:hypothetical protein